MPKVTDRHPNPPPLAGAPAAHWAHGNPAARRGAPGFRHAVLALALAAAACGSEARPRATGSPTPSPAVTSPSASPTPSVAVEKEFVQFSTPTKNIACHVDDSGASCEISRATWTLPPRPADCEFDWVRALDLIGAGEVEAGQCRSDTNLGAERVLAYGTGVEVGSYRCTSATDGVTCVHVPNGRGFFLSREVYRVLGGPDSASFRSPSGNIACAIDEWLECAVKERTWEPPADARCGAGEYVGLERWDGRVAFTCLDASHFAVDRVLAYGDSVTVGPIRCDSARDGVTCRVIKTGSGFFLGRASYRTYP